MNENEALQHIDNVLKEKVDAARQKKQQEEQLGLAILIHEDRKEDADEEKGFTAALFADLKQDIVSAIQDIKLDPQITVQPPIIPEIKVPEINVPEIKIPDIKVPEARVTVDIPPVVIPEIKIPEIKVPEIKIPKIVVPPVVMPDKMSVSGEVSLKGIDYKNPLPVILTGPDGKPYMAGYIGGSGGGVKSISDIQQLAGYPISVNSGLVDQGTLRTTIATDSGVSVNVTGFTSSVASVPTNGAGTAYNSDNPLPVTAPSTLDVRQVSGGAWSTLAHFSYANITAAATTTTVKGSAGLLHSVVINTRGTGSTVKLYDNTTDNGNLIATIDTTLSTTAFIYDVDFNSGLLAVTAGAGAADLTVSYN